MTDSPGLIGRHRVGLQAAPLGVAMLPPTWARTPLEERRVPKTPAELRADHDAMRDAQPMTVSCFFCGWWFDGTAGECRVEAAVHRDAKHPEAVSRRTPRRRKSLTRPELKMNDAEYEDAIQARREKDEAAQLASIERGRQRDAA